MSTPSRILSWREGVSELGVELVSPFQLALETTRISFEFLILNLGGSMGTIADSDPDVLLPHADTLIDQGFAWSVVDLNEHYDRDTAIEMLSDWGWSGKPANRPSWLIKPASD